MKLFKVHLKIYISASFSELNCEQKVLGRAYSVLSKRRAQVVSEVLRDGTSLFAIEAFLPVGESFGLAHELRSKASGEVSLHVQFSHWQMVEEDPFPEALMTADVCHHSSNNCINFLYWFSTLVWYPKPSCRSVNDFLMICYLFSRNWRMRASPVSSPFRLTYRGALYTQYGSARWSLASINHYYRFQIINHIYISIINHSSQFGRA